MSTRNVLWTASWYGWVFAEDFIRFKALTTSSGELKVPTAWYSHTCTQNCWYNWHINYDGWEYVQYVWTGWSWASRCITIATWLEPNSEHIVELRTYDILNNYWWALAFGWYNSWIADRLLEIIVDSTYLWFAVDATTTGNYFRYAQYRWCTNLRNAYEEYLPATVLDTWENFRCYQYCDCRSLLVPWTESAPNSIIEIKQNFRMHQYDWCTSLRNSSVEVMPNTVTVIWAHFRWWQYCNCTSITTAAAEVLPPTLQTIKADFRCSQYQNCTSLVTTSDEYMPDTVTVIHDQFRLSQFMWCTSLEYAPKEYISQNLEYWVNSSGTANRWFHYRHEQYRNCPKLKEVHIMSMPETFIWGNNYCRCDSFTYAWSQSWWITFYFSWPRVEQWDSGPAYRIWWIAHIYVPMDLVDAYKSSYWRSWSNLIEWY